MNLDELLKRPKAKTFEADFIHANPPFKVSDEGRDRARADECWRYGAPLADGFQSERRR
ncbi:MAG TPA: hypothetical protein VFD84_16900 [Candidatus Binatia bacterium]|nr:hypothetical protein [Candidatus Binatia bacterium]